MTRATLLAGACLAVLGTYAQGTANMVAGEYWVDTDPGWGQGTAISGLAQPNVASVPFQVPTGSLSLGMHTIGIRTKDAHGHWSLTNVTPVYVEKPDVNASIVRTEYFLNTDPGWGGGTDANVSGTDVVPPTATTASLTNGVVGMNTLFYRSKDAHGHWSLTNYVPLYVDAPDANAPIVRTEYFLNTDPGWGAGLDADVDGAAEIPPTATAADITDAVQGMNTLFYRTKDAHGHWSLTNQMPLYVENAPSGVVVAAESFWDVDPGFDQGDRVPNWTPNANVSGQFNVVVPENLQENAYHQLYVRTLDSHGHWSLTNYGVDSIFVDFAEGTDDLASASGISTYPNPFTEGITVRTDDGQPLRVVLYDPQGRLVHDKVLTGGTYIDLSGHAQGIYTAFFWKEKDRIHRVQLVKQ